MIKDQKIDFPRIRNNDVFFILSVVPTLCNIPFELILLFISLKLIHLCSYIILNIIILYTIRNVSFITRDLCHILCTYYRTCLANNV